MKTFKYFALILLLICFAGNAFVFAAEANVNYQGQADQFVFLPSSTDLFPNFKNVLPGDALTQEILLQNKTGHKVRIYLKGEPVGAREEIFLSQAALKGYLGGLELFHYGTANTGIASPLLLKELAAHESITMKVELIVPDKLIDVEQAEEYTLVWTFIAEEEIDEDDEKPPVTGESNIYLAAALLSFFLAFAFYAARETRRS